MVTKTNLMAPKSSASIVRVVAPSGVLPQARRMLDADSGLTFVQCTEDMEETLIIAQELAPCVLILSEENIANLKSETVPILLRMGVHTVIMLKKADDHKTADLLRMGHSGVLGMLNSARTIRKAIRAVACGEIWASRRLLSELVRHCILSAVARKLTPREAEILALIAQGYKNREIAERLFVTRETVRWHVRSLYSKLGIRDRNDLLKKDREMAVQSR